jgi:tRNA pseudouridine32 synthase/23S rRNA pseudouridine746 synthase
MKTWKPPCAHCNLVPEVFTLHIPAPCREDVKIVHVDDSLVVVDKPSGLLSVPGRYVKDCVLHRVFFEYADVSIVHRLDLDTSGLMVLARSKLAARELSRQFRERQVTKEYEAIVWGRVGVKEGEIIAPLSPDPVNRPRHVVDVEHGKEAITRFTTLDAEGKRSRLLLRPLTGRSHQLRVHLAHIGHPILGCDLYAHKDAFEAAGRLMLHAAKLALAHPATGRQMTFEQPAAFLDV